MQKNRLVYISLIFLILALIILIRLLDLQVIHYRFYKERAEGQRRRIIPLAADRGEIRDRNGRVLATSLDTFSLYVNPRTFTHQEELAKVLGEQVGPFNPQKLFAWVKRKIDRNKAQAASRIPGVNVLTEKKRVYPKGRLASQVLGFTGMDNEGLSGIELSYDKYLKGQEGRIITESDPRGYELLMVKEKDVLEAAPGMDLTLTIDETIQYLAERELAKTVEKYRALSGTLLIMDIQTGEILALAGKPDFDPNEYAKFNPQRWRSAAADVYEPGSTFKVITAAAALEKGAINLDTKLTAVNELTLGGKVIKNSHQIKWERPYMSVSYMLEQSINTGAIQVALKLGPQKFYEMIKRFGFGESTAVGLPGESRGLLKPPERWYKPDIGMMSFGQSIGVTPVQLISAIASLANGGKRVRPVLVKKIESLDGSFVKTYSGEELNRSVSEKTAKAMMQLMENVVLFGTGRRAQMANYRSAGKTGTAQKVFPGGFGYMKGHYIASFVGVAPLDDPRLAALIIVDDPQGSIWGESVAGPVFKEVVEGALRYLNVPPDLRYN